MIPRSSHRFAAVATLVAVLVAVVSLPAGSCIAAPADSSQVESAPQSYDPQTDRPTPVRAARDSAAGGTEVPTMRVRVVDGAVAVLRSGPGTEHALVASVDEDAVLVVDARTGDWYHVLAADGTSGWVHHDLVRNADDGGRFTFRPDPSRAERLRKLSLTGFLGSYAADREDNGFLYGARMGYSVTSRFTFEVGVGHTRIVRSTYIIEQLFNLRLEEETFRVFFYEAGLTWDLLPGRRVSPFVGAAVGATILNARVEPTWSAAIGTRAYLSRKLALRWEIRDHRLEAGNQSTRFTGDNIEFSAGTELLF